MKKKIFFFSLFPLCEGMACPMFYMDVTISCPCLLQHHFDIMADFSDQILAVIPNPGGHN